MVYNTFAYLHSIKQKKIHFLFLCLCQRLLRSFHSIFPLFLVHIQVRVSGLLTQTTKLWREMSPSHICVALIEPMHTYQQLGAM